MRVSTHVPTRQSIRKATRRYVVGIRGWALGLVGRIHDAAWTYDEASEKQINRAMWTLFWTAVVVMSILMLPRHGA